jgi:hypothetical protein
MANPVPVSFGRGSNKGRFGQIGQCSHINAYVEDLGNDGKTAYSAQCINGLGSFASLTSSTSGVEAMLAVDSNLIALSGRLVYSITAAGVVSLVGGMPSDGFASMARNRLTPNPQTAIVRDGLVFIHQAGSVDQLTDPNLPPPVFVFEVQGYFMFLIGDGRFFAIGPNSTVIDPTSFAEAESDPDGLVAGASRGRTAVFFGYKTTEFWDPNGAVDGVPFGFTTAINFGCYAPGSVAKLPKVQGGQVTDTLVLALTDHNGAYLGIATLDGYVPTLISNPEVDRAIKAEPDKDSIRSMAITEDGRPVYIITGSSFTYGYDSKANAWHQRMSKGSARWRGNCAANFAGKVLYGSATLPTIYYSDRDLNDEDGDPIDWIIQMPPIVMYPKGFKVGGLYVDMISGVGINSGVDQDDNPQLIISYSKDGGQQFTAETRHDLGTMGQRGKQVRRHGLGRFDHNGMTLRLQCSARVSRGLQQVAIEATPLR